jgi:hypothetical protein
VSRAVSLTKLWHRRVATSIFVLNGLSRSKARAAANALPLETQLDALYSTVAMLGASKPHAGAAAGVETGLANEQDGDDEASDDGEMMEMLLDAGAKVTPDGSLIIDTETITVLEGDDASAADELGTADANDSVNTDATVRETAAPSVLDALDRRRTLVRLAAKPRRSWQILAPDVAWRAPPPCTHLKRFCARVCMHSESVCQGLHLMRALGPPPPPLRYQPLIFCEGQPSPTNSWGHRIGDVSVPGAPHKKLRTRPDEYTISELTETGFTKRRSTLVTSPYLCLCFCVVVLGDGARLL